MVGEELIKMKERNVVREIDKKDFLKEIEDIFLYKMIPTDLFIKGLVKKALTTAFGLLILLVLITVIHIMFFKPLHLPNCVIITMIFIYFITGMFMGIFNEDNEPFFRKYLVEFKNKKITNILTFAKDKIDQNKFKELYEFAVKENLLNLTFSEIEQDKETHKKSSNESWIENQQNEIQQSLLKIYYKSIS